MPQNTIIPKVFVSLAPRHADDAVAWVLLPMRRADHIEGCKDIKKLMRLEKYMRCGTQCCIAAFDMAPPREAGSSLQAQNGIHIHI